MKDVTEKNFGFIIAFLLPGFLFLWGLSYSQPDLASWLLNMSNKDAPLIGSFLYATIASLALGLVISAVRMVLFDKFLYRITRLESPNYNSAKLKDNKETLEAFKEIIENHFRYYQYYANSLIAIAAAAGHYVATKGLLPSTSITILVIIIIVILGLASREELRSFNKRAEDITR